MASPKILPCRAIQVKNYGDIHGLVKSFNSNFSTFGIAVVEDDLKIECLHEKKRIAEKKLKMTELEAIVRQGRANPEKLRKFDSIGRWESESAGFTWKISSINENHHIICYSKTWTISS